MTRKKSRKQAKKWKDKDVSRWAEDARNILLLQVTERQLTEEEYEERLKSIEIMEQEAKDKCKRRGHTDD